MDMATVILAGGASMFSRCELCIKQELLKMLILIVSFIFGTVDLVTDWINFIQWSSVGGYDQYNFVSIFQTTFLFAAFAGTILWTIEVALLVVRSRECIQRYRERYIVGIRRGERNVYKWLGLTVRLSIGLMEDLPVVILLYNSVAMPLCGIPAKRESSSPTTIATVVSAMLNSMWTVFVLCWDLFGCYNIMSNAQCWCNTIRSEIEPQTSMFVWFCGCCGCAAISVCRCLCLRRNQTGPPSGSSAPRRCAPIGIIIKICKRILKGIFFLIILVIFGGIFLLSTMTLSLAYNRPTLDRAMVVMGPSSTAIKADKFGPGLDARPDAAMFATMVYELPNWYHVGLYDNRDVNIANSASVYQIQNRLYIGQFNELEHLKDGTLTKAIPCNRVFPFLDKIDGSLFRWNNSQKINMKDFSNCKLMFRLRYYPTNNHWNPFDELVQPVTKFITIELGFHVKDHETCPTGFQPLPVSSLLTDTVKQDIVNYTCSPSCINATDICRNATYGRFEESPFERRSSSGLVSRPQFYLTINDQQFTDSCIFETTFLYTTEFCDKVWADGPAIKVPDFVEGSYTQFLTMPMTYKETGNIPYRFLDSKCSKLWAEGEKLWF